MGKKSVALRLLVRSGDRLLLKNVPPGYDSILGPLPEGASAATRSRGSFDVVQIFVRSMKELEHELQSVNALIGPETGFWVTFQKMKSKVIKGDLNRNTITAFARTAGFGGVSIIAIDDQWSALRLKRKK